MTMMITLFALLSVQYSDISTTGESGAVDVEHREPGNKVSQQVSAVRVIYDSVISKEVILFTTSLIKQHNIMLTRFWFCMRHYSKCTVSK